jgi:iron complex outermembrane receptor protein
MTLRGSKGRIAMRHHTLGWSAAAFSILALASAAHAQPAGEVLEEIVVTAQKRVQNLQDVPIAVTAIGPQLLQDSGARDVRDLQLLVPGLTMTSTTSESVLSARLRGIGTVGDNPGLESSVGVVVDGVYRPRNGVGSGDLGGTERIEVLKGPQSTLFGKSTSAGAINIVTTAPSFDFGAGAEATIGTYSNRGGSAWINGPLMGDKIAGRLYVAKRQRDGYLDVVTGPGPRTLKEDQDQDVWTIRGQLLLRPDERTTVRVIADYTERNENCCLTVQTDRGTAATSRANIVDLVRPGSTSPRPDPFARVAYANRDNANEVYDRGISGQVDYDFGAFDLVSISAFRTWANKRGQESDFTAADILYRPVGRYTDEFDTFTQEFRLTGDTGRVAWLAGVFLGQEDYEGRSPIHYGTDYYAYWAGRVLSGAPGLIGAVPANTFVPGTGQNDTFQQDATSLGVFTNNTIDLTEAWDLTFGLRYSSESKTLTSNFNTTGGSCARARAAFPLLAGAAGLATAGLVTTGLCLPWENDLLDARSGVQKREDNEWSGTIKTSYRWSPDGMGYASYARGFKAGGFNFDRPNTTLSFTPTSATLNIAPSTAFPAETVDAYEVGVKTEWFDKRLALNLALFHQTYENFQLNSFVGTQFVVESLPQVISRGADFEFLLRSAIEGLTVQGGATWAETEIQPFVAADLAVPGNFAGFARLPGSRLSFAPLWSGSTAVSYETPVGSSGLSAGFNVSAKFTTGYNTGSDLAPQKYQEGYTVVNARLGVGNDTWRLEAWGANLFDTEYKQVAINSPLQGTENDPVAIRTYSAFLAPPRTYGLTLRVTY